MTDIHPRKSTLHQPICDHQTGDLVGDAQSHPHNPHAAATRSAKDLVNGASLRQISPPGNVPEARAGSPVPSLALGLSFVSLGYKIPLGTPASTRGAQQLKPSAYPP